MTTFFTSDLHFGHTNIIGYAGRPYADVTEMNVALADNWNAVVAPHDIVYVLGDVFMGRLDESFPFGRRLNGVKILKAGNHDRCHPANNAKHADWLDTYLTEGGFDFIVPWDETPKLTIADKPVILNHFPYQDIGRHSDRFSAYVPEYEGEWLLHGHTHVREVFSDHPQQLHIGTDAWGYTPVSIDEIAELLKDREA